MLATGSRYVVLAVGAALLFGLGPIFSKRGQAADGTWVGNALTVVGVRVGLFWIALFATAGTGALSGIDPAIAGVFALGSIAASGLGRMAFYVGVDRVGSSLTNALANTRPLYAVFLAVVWLGEPVGTATVLGVGLVVAGLVVTSLSRGGNVEGWDRRSLLFPVIAAVGYALGNVVRRFGFTHSSVSVFQALAVGETASLTVVVAYVLLAGKRGDLRVRRRTHALFATSGVIAGAGLLALFAALSAGPVAIVDPLVATSPLFTVAFAAFLLREHERVTPRIVVGSAIIVAGAALLT